MGTHWAQSPACAGHQSDTSEQNGDPVDLGMVQAMALFVLIRGCAPDRIRTCDTRFRRAVLCPLSYEGGTTFRA